MNGGLFLVLQPVLLPPPYHPVFRSRGNTYQNPDTLSVISVLKGNITVTWAITAPLTHEQIGGQAKDKKYHKIDDGKWEVDEAGKSKRKSP